MADKNKIRFTINGKAYTLLHDEPEEYMHRIEHYLNTRVAAVSKSGIQLGEQTAIVMAAISITDELFKTQKNFNTLKNEIKRMMDEYDRLKSEKQELDEQLTTALQQVDKLSKQLLLARHGAYTGGEAIQSTERAAAGTVADTAQGGSDTAPERTDASDGRNASFGSVSGNIFYPANYGMDDDE